MNGESIPAIACEPTRRKRLVERRLSFESLVEFNSSRRLIILFAGQRYLERLFGQSGKPDALDDRFKVKGQPSGESWPEACLISPHEIQEVSVSFIAKPINSVSTCAWLRIDSGSTTSTKLQCPRSQRAKKSIEAAAADVSATFRTRRSTFAAERASGGSRSAVIPTSLRPSISIAEMRPVTWASSSESTPAINSRTRQTACRPTRIASRNADLRMRSRPRPVSNPNALSHRSAGMAGSSRSCYTRRSSLNLTVGWSPVIAKIARSCCERDGYLADREGEKRMAKQIWYKKRSMQFLCSRT